MKLFYKISEASRITGLEAYVLRFWETEFPEIAPRKSKGGQRVYEQKDIERILTIKKMLYEDGLTIAGARKRLEEQKGKAVPAAPPVNVIDRAIDELEGVLNILK